MSDTNCPNCGAPKRGSVCEYCGTHFSRYQGDATVTVEPDYVTVYGWDGQPVARFSNGENVTIVTDRWRKVEG